MKIFADTNILLDVLVERQPFYNTSAQIWTLAESGQIKACISTISFNNTYYVIRKLQGKATAQKVSQLLRDVFIPIPPANQVLFQAIDAEVDDFEDALQFHSALANGCNCLVSRDPDGFPPGPIPILSPVEFVAYYASRIKQKST